MKRSLAGLGIVMGLTALLHGYIGWRIIPALDTYSVIEGTVGAYLVLSTLLIPRGFSIKSHTGIQETLHWAGLVLMGAFSSLLVATLLREGALVIGYFVLNAERYHQLYQGSAWFVIMFTLLLTLWGYINARRTAAVVPVNIPLAQLSKAFDGLRIVQLSDVHVGPTIKRNYIEKIVARVNALDADVIVLTGDLIDGQVEQLREHIAPLAQLKSRLGVYVINGNHEYYSNEPAWIAEYTRLGMVPLKNQHTLLTYGGQQWVLAGVNDYSAKSFGSSDTSDPVLALQGAPTDTLKILLAHQPRSADAAEQAGFDLQLSGHTHGGQFWPWNHFVRVQQPYTAGLHQHGRMWIYISRGTGYWGPPKRFGAPSEITLITLKAAAG